MLHPKRVNATRQVDNSGQSIVLCISFLLFSKYSTFKTCAFTYFSCDPDYSFKDSTTEKMYRCRQEQVNGGEPYGMWRLEGSGEGGATPEPCYSKLILTQVIYTFEYKMCKMYY